MTPLIDLLFVIAIVAIVFGARFMPRLGEYLARRIYGGPGSRR